MIMIMTMVMVMVMIMTVTHLWTRLCLEDLEREEKKMKLSDRWFSSSSHISDGWEYDDYFYDVVCHYHDDYDDDGGHSGYGGRWGPVFLSVSRFQVLV